MLRKTLTGLFFVIMLIGSANAAPIPTYSYPSGFDAEGAAGTTNGQVRTYTGSDGDINNNLSRPLMSSEQMTAFDGTPFNSQLACPSTVSFLELFAVPGGTGDITTLTVKQDLDTDGTTDRVYNIPVPVSGVCANGVLSCDPGTWNRCQAYKWDALATGELSLVPGPLSDLGGCYCINNHCGSNLVMSNLPKVLGDIGGGAANVMAKVNPLFTISRVDVAGPVIQYYGQDAGDCGFFGSTNQTQFYSNPTSMPTATSSATSTGVVLPNSTTNPTGTVTISSMYDLLSRSTAATSEPRQLFNCTVDRTITLDEVTLNDIIAYNGGSGGIMACGQGCLQLVLGTVGNNYWSGTCGLYQHDVSFWVQRPDRVISATLMNARFDDHIQVSMDGSLIWAHASGWTDLSSTSYPPGTSWWRGTPYCERSTSWNINPGVDFTSAIAVAGAHNFKIRVAVAGGGEGYAYAQVLVNESCIANPEVVVNQCTAYESDPACVLVEETVDGVATYSNYNPTGLTPLPTQQTITGTSCSINETRPWWHKERTYLCPTGSTYSFNNVYDRVATIQDSATLTGYDDYRLNESTGSWQIETGQTLSTPTVPTVGVCTQACKTRKPIAANDAAGLGPTQDMRNANKSYEFFYHECDTSGACPMGAGEELLEACQCIDDFAEATAIMQSMRMAGRDMICTSGAPVSLP